MNGASAISTIPAGDRSSLAHSGIRSLMLSGELEVGDTLKEVDLAERLSVSRTPVREALHRLDVEGVVTRQGRSYVVAGLEPAEEHDIAQVRRALEPLAASLAAEAVAAGRVAPVEIEALRALVDDLERAAGSGDAPAAAEANHRFHVLLAEMGRNDVLATTVVQLNDRVAISSFQRLGSVSWAAEAAGQHRAIVDAVADGDPGAARAATDAHLASVHDAVDPEPIGHARPHS